SAWILAASLAFYGWWRLDFLLLMVATTAWSHLLCRSIERNLPLGRARAKRALTAGILLNIGTLAYFKYFNFGIDSLSSLLLMLGGQEITAWQVILPIGISFYVFQATSYLIDVYRGDAEPAKSYLDVAAYITLFPQLVAGPIVRYGHIAPQLAAREHSIPRFSEGAWRFMIGFAKKVLIADSVASLANAGFGVAAPHAGDAWLGLTAYAVQIFFDFSGYSDMAIGLGLMIGFRFPENFDRPYTSRSITEFWRRWHMSLSRWLRDYLYIPLGGNRRGSRRTYANLLTVMVIGGLWHGAAWTFVLWGAWHGLWLAVERLVTRRREGRRREEPAPVAATGRAPAPADVGGGATRAAVAVTAVAGNIYAMTLVLAGWILFRSPDLATAGDLAAGLVGVHGLGLSNAMAWQVDGLAVAALLLGVVLIYAGPALERSVRRPGTPVLALRTRDAAVSLLFIAGVVKLVAESYSPFLYFQF
ncbi:MAG: membrane-bound O-acyltransferase family protein, partial [Spirochaetes bacterium]|nr:membrane-bound O-acyltransferase family protein [Spirochaetota bacterium]